MSVRAVGRRKVGPRMARGPKALRRLAEETGGGYFEVTRKEPIEKIYAQIEDDLRNQYSIGYTPSPAGKSGEYRKVTLGVRNKKMMARTRDGYYAK
jgi:VWFA-related protein